MSTFVLVPGFWLGAWAWEDVARELRAAGHDVHPVTLTGLADRAGEATPGVGVETHIADVVRVIEDGGLRDVVLVGHSGANQPVTGAADRLPAGRVARLVYVDTAPLPPGMGVIDFNDPGTQESWRRQVAEEGDGWRLPVPAFDPADDPENLAGLTGEQLDRMRALCTPQPFRTATDPFERAGEPSGMPCSLIATTFTPEAVRELAATGNPLFAPLAAMDLWHLPTGHWPMFSAPGALAALLDGIARG
ncbi:alpha/beta fold hydrolase [Streptomyces sp. UNOC14_S4]|uniref:alpha/beta fold hydrolase n=1 Tax=Streptomyces sp. UNOC14_S4 TaxID=2872340 RepID=UPI001E5B131F|nr:alpha/beta hydrolase [Streptomyces sp. UNOC14_S4]MCC3768509.1 alpha/beta hydrolase [Streptomyces sp. UNOC14_S4]